MKCQFFSSKDLDFCFWMFFKDERVWMGLSSGKHVDFWLVGGNSFRLIKLGFNESVHLRSQPIPKHTVDGSEF